MTRTEARQIQAAKFRKAREDRAFKRNGGLLGAVVRFFSIVPQ